MNTTNLRPFKSALFLFVLFFQVLQADPDKHFVIAIAAQNDKEWFKQNLDSIFSQSYKNFRVIYVDDASTDGTPELVQEYVKKKGWEDKFLLVRNTQSTGPLGCLCKAAFMAHEDDIIVDVNGRDWLAHNEVLNKLNAAYADPDIWMTYGQLVFYPVYAHGFSEPIPEGVAEENSFRMLRRTLSALRTFYASLFHKIKKEDFLFENRFFPQAGDLAFFIPIAEMSGEHIKFISEITYLLNFSYPLPLHRIPTPLEESLDDYIRAMPKYAPVSKPNTAMLHIYNQIEDMSRPTLHDYRFIQDYLSYGKRENLERLKEAGSEAKNLRIVGNLPSEFPVSGMISVNCDERDRNNCILLYAPFNEDLGIHLMKLVHEISRSSFKGHILYRLGGWPNTEGGDLRLAHVPNAYKVCSFREAERLGFKRALWINPLMENIQNVHALFDSIKNNGYICAYTQDKVGPFINRAAAAFFGLNLENTYEIPLCKTDFFGVDFTNKGHAIIDHWYRAACDKDAFFTERPDENALSIILHEMNPLH